MMTTDEINRRALDSSRRALGIAEETRNTSAGTLVELHKQGEQMDRCVAKMDGVHAELDNATWVLRGMRSVTGAVANYFSSPPATAAAGRSAPAATTKAAPKAAPNNRYTEIRRDVQQKQTEEDEVDRTLEQLARAVGDIRRMGEETGEELRRHEPKLDCLQESVLRADARLRRANHDIKRIA
eukprot:TRINITY_DN12180_c0_g1_i1.p2 TRINITY_DN12180_c0_g1~~TRINITY_DN12180_c0_g1_i1.p2  ORF type:complete len:183 (+),score=55.28 TRINITY_DN12180_c0_g1_i1:161-709(+)